jgi:hypothetical protein
MYRAVSANKRNTYIIMVGFVLLIAALAFVAQLMFGGSGFIFWGTLVGAIIYVAIQYYAAR